jgi:hypothetical protein
MSTHQSSAAETWPRFVQRTPDLKWQCVQSLVDSDTAIGFTFENCRAHLIWCFLGSGRSSMCMAATGKCTNAGLAVSCQRLILTSGERNEKVMFSVIGAHFARFAARGGKCWSFGNVKHDAPINWRFDWVSSFSAGKSSRWLCLDRKPRRSRTRRCNHR